MVDGGINETPYHAVLALAAWAAENWWLVDGKCALVGFDPLDLPVARFFNLLYVMVLEGIYDHDERVKVMNTLDWPDVAEIREAEESDRQARAAMAALGVTIDFDAFSQNEAVPTPDAS